MRHRTEEDDTAEVSKNWGAVVVVVIVVRLNFVVESKGHQRSYLEQGISRRSFK